MAARDAVTYGGSYPTYSCVGVPPPEASAFCGASVVSTVASLASSTSQSGSRAVRPSAPLPGARAPVLNSVHLLAAGRSPWLDRRIGASPLFLGLTVKGGGVMQAAYQTLNICMYAYGNIRGKSSSDRPKE